MEWRAITVRYPYSALIVDGLKPTENRAPGFPRKYRGGVIVHEAKARSERGMADLRFGAAYRNATKRVRYPIWYPGMYVGCVHLVDVHDAEPGCCESEWAEQEYIDAAGRLQPNPVHLVLERARRFRYPMYDRGRLGLWRPIPQVIDLLPL